MGGAQTKNLTNIVNNSAASVIVDNISKCSTNVGQIQKVSISGSWLFGFNASQSASISQKCVADFQMTGEIANQIAADIQQKAEAQSIAVLDLLSGSKAQNQSTIASYVSSTIKTSNIQQAAMSVMQTQDISVTGSIATGVNVSQSASVVQQAIMNAVARTNLANIISSNTSQSASAKQSSPLDFLGNYMFYLVVFIIVLIFGVLFILFGDNLFG